MPRLHAQSAATERHARQGRLPSDRTRPAQGVRDARPGSGSSRAGSKCWRKASDRAIQGNRGDRPKHCTSSRAPERLRQPTRSPTDLESARHRGEVTGNGPGRRKQRATAPDAERPSDPKAASVARLRSTSSRGLTCTMNRSSRRRTRISTSRTGSLACTAPRPSATAIRCRPTRDSSARCPLWPPSARKGPATRPSRGRASRRSWRARGKRPSSRPLRPAQIQPPGGPVRNGPAPRVGPRRARARLWSAVACPQWPRERELASGRQ